ncbi:hypothetical protein EXM22_02015 [Oceanispirochaeta crateris]|uniref:LA2681-like HEPN domain-containing protein n=1 Tax=Oceanispirochaeta crateris TaxID=2518645 RepID=A0A5C1QJY4_9SPIO|nr:LA2681 family HEPN domain-containing protein [Oceanispirochaeta crateris]QEN06826.1 hypothetical protein EXM22_02015 [Oceanispirochaeta crateris]
MDYKKMIFQFGVLIDTFSDSCDDKNLSKLISEIEIFVEKEKIEKKLSAILFYYLGNAWSSLDNIRNRNDSNIWLLNRDEFDQSIINYRKAINQIDDNGENSNLSCSLFTNLANAYSQIGRPISAIALWNKSLLINKNFQMAIGNKGQGLFEYSKMMYDPSHRDLIGRESFFLLSKLDYKKLHYTASEIFKNIKEKLGSYFSDEYLRKEFDTEKYELGSRQNEIDYWNWVLNTSLFLNPLNDINKSNTVAHDILSLPSMIVPKELKHDEPIFHRLFNEIKQEFISLRYFYYKYLISQEDLIHFSDSNRNLINTLDYSQLGLKYEYLKISFRMAYSIFDKISYFLNKYLVLNIPDHKVSFKNIWREYDTGKNKFTKELCIHIIDLKNKPLRGLYFISRDFYELDESLSLVLDPDAKNIAKIRNYIEHKSFIIHWDIAGWTEKESYSYHIAEKDFSNKCFFLIEKVREAIIYLSLSVHSEEEKSENDDITIPIIMPSYDY